LAHVEITEDMIISLPEFGAERTAGDLLDRAAELLGADVVLRLDGDVATERVCPACGAVMDLYRPKAEVFREELACPCGKAFQWDSDFQQTQKISAYSSPKLLRARLLDLGVARFGFIEARFGEGEVIFFELAGDSEGLTAHVVNCAAVGVGG